MYSCSRIHLAAGVRSSVERQGEKVQDRQTDRAGEAVHVRCLSPAYVLFDDISALSHAVYRLHNAAKGGEI